MAKVTRRGLIASLLGLPFLFGFKRREEAKTEVVGIYKGISPFQADIVVYGIGSGKVKVSNIRINGIPIEEIKGARIF